MLDKKAELQAFCREYEDMLKEQLPQYAIDGVLPAVQIVPDRKTMEVLKGFFKTRQWAIKTTVQKEPKRYLLAFMKHQCDSLDFGEGIIQDAPNKRSAWYEQLTKDFYL